MNRFNIAASLAVIFILFVTVLACIEHSPQPFDNNMKCSQCKCNIPMMMGRSKCYDCDTQIANTYCNNCKSIHDSYLSRLNIKTANARLGHA